MKTKMKVKDAFIKALNEHALYFYFALNPLVISIIVVSYKPQQYWSDFELALLGLYMIVWTAYGILFLALPQIRAVIKKAREPKKIRTLDEIIDDSWKEYEQEKKNANHQSE